MREHCITVGPLNIWWGRGFHIGFHRCILHRWR